MPRMRQYGIEGNLIWNEMKKNLPSNFREDDS
jgi:GntR family negative regulator for fad regulon and positive regulator of fabA